MARRVAIIGAGIAGLCAGVYAQLNGYQASIYAMHSIPGGLCTAWKRKGYTVDACIAWLLGSSPASGLHSLWQEVGLLEGQRFIYMDRLSRFDGPDGQSLTLYTDLDRLQEEMVSLSPQDAPLTRALIRDARRLAATDLTKTMTMDTLPLPERVTFLARLLPKLPTLNKWGRISMGDLAERFTHPLLRDAFASMWFPEMPATVFLMSVGWMGIGAAGYPIGGSVPLARAVEKRFLDLGGEVHYNARVERILTENDRAVGLRLADGSEVRADAVISAADGHATIFDMLGGRYVDDTIRGYYERLTPFPPILYLGLGVNRTFDDEPQTIGGISFPLDRPTRIGDTEVRRLAFHPRNYDPTMAPAGKTTITVTVPNSYAYWKDLRTDRAAYEAAKQEVADTVVGLLDRRCPGLASQVEMVDVATPATWERYTGNWQASWEGWLPTVKDNSLGMRMRRTLPGLDGFYMVGQWVAPGGGLPGGVMTAREVLQTMCKRDGVRFHAPTA